MHNSTPAPPGSSNALLKNVYERAKLVLLTPKEAWPVIKEESTSLKDIYLYYLLPLAAAAALCGFIGTSIIGMRLPVAGPWRVPVGSGLAHAVLSVGTSLAGVFVAALVVEFLVPKFEGEASRTAAFKLVAYSMTASYAAGLLSIIPSLGLLGGLFSLYGAYLFYVGIPTLVNVREEKRLYFCLASFLSIVVVMWILAAVMMVANPISHPMG